MKLVLIRAKRPVDKEVKRSIENDVNVAIAGLLCIWGRHRCVSCDVDVSEITQGEETLWVDGRRMEASDFNGDIDEKD
ncbi:hypothetical protein [Bacillus subtilis]|uniref:hypothetical protein n=1 Tax=Bacillus subtilis TaxID=1423 RepID=UPI003D34EFED